DRRQINGEWERKWFNDQRSHLTPERIHGGIIGGSEATGAALGDFFQYSIDHPVSLARQKSAMLPIVNKEVEGSRVSIYNPSVQLKHPLLGLRFKNTSGSHLAQGPITVFEGSTYAGDTRVLDVQPNEERLVSYAIDLGTEIEPQLGEGTTKITSIKAVKGIITATAKVREVRKYRMKNSSKQDRVLILEHAKRFATGETPVVAEPPVKPPLPTVPPPSQPTFQAGPSIAELMNRPSAPAAFKLVETEKLIEDTRDVYRFQISLKAGEEKSFTVTEELDLGRSIEISNSSEHQLKYFVSLNEASPVLKQKLGEALKMKGVWDALQDESAHLVEDLNRLNQDQDRIRKNLANTPKEAEVYQTYLKKLSDQEKEIDALTAKQKKLMADEFAAKKRFEDYLGNISD
ncbi:MAG TPA: hypothetical protein VGL71_12465, partial [Urbifossiella sp.]